MHTARKDMKYKCLVCGVDPGKDCITASIEGKESNPMDEPEAQLAWAEFAVMAAIHNLRECKRDHYLVVLVEAALTDALDRGEAGQGDNLPVMLRNQAD